MKTQLSRRKNGFTLVELLVVITIIAVLAGVGFAAGNMAIQRAKKLTALSAATSLESAVNAFYSEYGSLPQNLTADEEIDTVQDPEILNVLLGFETATTVLNSKGIRFLSVKEAKSKKEGVVYNSGGTPPAQGMYDPWGGSYKIMLDGDYNETIAPKPKGGGATVTLNGRRVAVWSDGLDGVTATGKSSDDVKTWGN